MSVVLPGSLPMLLQGISNRVYVAWGNHVSYSMLTFYDFDIKFFNDRRLSQLTRVTEPVGEPEG